MLLAQEFGDDASEVAASYTVHKLQHHCTEVEWVFYALRSNFEYRFYLTH